MFFSLNGSARRFVAFLGALVAVSVSHWLVLDTAALGAIVTITMAYLGQGAMKEVQVCKLQPPAASQS